MKNAKTKWAKSDTPDNIEAIIDKAVDDALRRINLESIVRDIFKELDIASIVRRTIAEVQADNATGI